MPMIEFTQCHKTSYRLGFHTALCPITGLIFYDAVVSKFRDSLRRDGLELLNVLACASNLDDDPAPLALRT